MISSRRKNNTGSYQNRQGRHIIQYTVDGKRKTVSYPTEIEARTALANLSGPKGLQNNKNPLKSATLGELFKKWIEAKDPTPTFYGYWVRWNKHWAELIGGWMPNQLEVHHLKSAIVDFRLKGLNNSYIGLLFRILSAFLNELLEDGVVEKNVVALLSKKSRKDFISKKDPSKSAFLKKTEDISSVYTWLNGNYKSVSVAFAIGALAGLRVNEIRALSWEDIDFDKKLIHVRWQASESKYGAERLTPPKNKMGRQVPMSDSLYSILQNWFETTRGEGWVVRPKFTEDKNKRFIGKDLLRLALKRALKALRLPKLTWYSATRHTFGSHYIMAGGSLNKLREILGHSSSSTTEKHYVHLVPGQFSDADRNVIQVEMKEHEKPVDWRLLEIDSKVRGDILPNDGNWNNRDSRPNGQ